MTSSTVEIFHRKTLAEKMAKRLLTRSVSYDVRDGLFLSSGPGTGKTTFLNQDLIPMLQACGAHVFYVELGQRCKKISAVRYLKGCLCKAFRAYGEGFFNCESADSDRGVTYSQAFVELAERTSRSIALIIDDVDELACSRSGENCLCELKAARDAVNLRYPNTEETYLLILGVGSCRAKVRRLTAGPSQAFFGSINEDFPLLGEDYLRWQIERSAEVKYPSSATLTEGFEILGFQPELLRTVLQEQRSSHEPLNEEDFLNFCRKKASVAVSDVVSAVYPKPSNLPSAQSRAFSRSASCRISPTGQSGAQRYFSFLKAPFVSALRSRLSDRL